ncbi:MAG: carboxypeptidase regulatory-like domain-containing protein, partial [Planctomycetes bacterium]|nr:carboxypeptidase regulatory-like domain-containing protein [Planctomycetota bacterium]
RNEDYDAAARAREDDLRRRGKREWDRSTGTLQGRILDPHGEPAANARVLVLHAPELGSAYDIERAFASHLPLDQPEPERLFCDRPSEHATDGNGHFQIGTLPPGRLRLLVLHPGAVRYERDDLLVVAGTNSDLGDLRLARGRRVRLQSERGLPFDGKTVVTLRSTFADLHLPALTAAASVELGRANARGELITAPLGPGRYEMLVACERMLPVALTIEADGRDPPRAAVRQGVELRVHLSDVARGHTARFVRALPREREKSVVPFDLRADARVATVYEDTSTALLTGLQRDTLYELRSASVAQGWDDLSPWNPPIECFGNAERMRMLYLADARLTGTVTSTKQGVPLAGVALELAGGIPSKPRFLAQEDPRSETRDDGAFRLLGVRPRAGAPLQSLVVRGRNHGRAERPLALVPGDTLDLEPIGLPVAPRVQVVVRDAKDGRAIVGARVTTRPLDALSSWIDDAPAEALTDSGGAATLPTWGLPNTRLRVDAAGYAPVERGFAPHADSTPLVRFDLARGTTVRVRVVDPSGAPIPGLRVGRRDGPWSPNQLVSDPRGDPRRVALGRWDREPRADGETSAWTGPDGVAVFPRIAPGKHAFHVERRPPLQAFEWTLRDVPSAEEFVVELASQRRVACAGRIVWDDKTPLAHAEIALVVTGNGRDLREPDEPLPPGLDARTGADGSFRFENLLPGGYQLVVRIPDQRWRYVEAFVLGEEPKPLRIVLLQRTVLGQVVDTTGAPAADAEIEVALPVADEVKNASPSFGSGVESQQRTFGGFGRLVTADGTGAFRLAGVRRGEALVVRARRGSTESSMLTTLFWSDKETFPPRVGLRLERRGEILLAVGDPNATSDAVGSSDMLVVLSSPLSEYGREARIVRRSPGAHFPALAPGEWTVCAVPWPVVAAGKEREPIVLFGDDATVPPRRVTVVAGETSLVDFAQR